ncbi:MAG: S-layer homology domain-containing protein [Clostridia bacterium]|nr:S-layer homology domain-containing protein [Clostridia bacterium]
MKKIISLLLCAVLMLADISIASAAKDESRIYSLGLLDNVPKENTVSRLDFTKVTMRLLGFFDVDVIPGGCKFNDVEEKDSGYVSFAVSMGIISQSEDGLFRPLDNVTDYEAVKMLVCALGYSSFASQYGDWPTAYAALAAKLKMLNGVNVSGKDLTYAEMIILINNVLDLYPLEYSYSGVNQGLEEADETVYEKLMSHREMKKIMGVFESTSCLSVAASSAELGENRIMIGGEAYNASKDFSKYLGYYVEAYVREEEDEVVSVVPFRNKNEEIEVDADKTEISGLAFEYYDENDKKHTEHIDSNAAYVLNGRKLDNPTDEQISIYSGSYRILDNNGDGKFDIVFINQGQSFVAAKISSGTNTIYFDDDLTFRGSEALRLDYDDNDKTYIIEDKDGNEMNFSDIEVGDAVTIFADLNSDFVRICVSKEKIEGSITSISEDDGVVLNGKNYKIAVDDSGKVQYDAELGTLAVYVIDVFGRICGVAEELENEYKYAYVVRTGVDDDDNDKVWLRLITGAEPQKHVTVKNDEEIISYYYQNEDMFTLNTEQKVVLNDKSVSAEAILDKKLEGKVIGYKLSSGGNIKNIYTYDLPGRIYSATFNAKITAFSSSTDGRGYLMNKKTAVICVPKTVNSDEDWYVRVHVEDENSTMCVWGQTVSPENPLYSDAANAEPVDFIILNADMDSTQPVPVQDTDKVCILGSTSRLVSEIEKDYGEVVTKLEFLEEDRHEFKTVAAGTEAEKIADGLHKGDIFQYVEDGYGRIVTIKKIASMQGLGNDYKETIYGDYFGLVSDIRLSQYDYISNKIADIVKIDIGTGERQVKIFNDDPQPIYRYDRKTGNIYVGSTEDMASYKQVGDLASKAYAYMVDGDLIALVIIED